MSAPTLTAAYQKQVCSCSEPEYCESHGMRFVNGERPVTPADVRLWLLDQGAEEWWRCDEHKVIVPNKHDHAIPGDSMVSVLVWKDGGS